MARKYNYIPIKTIKDWDGEDWDVYEERKTPAGVMIYKGWMYSQIVKIKFIYILTDELAEFLRNHDRAESIKLLGLTVKIVTKFRRELGIQQQYSHKSKALRAWIIEHQDELFKESFPVLKEKYDLTQLQVERYCRFLREYAGVERKNKMRLQKTSYISQKKIQNIKEALVACQTIDEVQQLLKEKNNRVARWAHNQICKQHGIPTLNDIRVQHLNEIKQWRLTHQEILLSKQYSIKEIAKRLNKSEREILTARNYLKNLLSLSEKKDSA
jgi:hypothetical protein